LVSRIAARPLDRSRPLWELYMIEGLQDGYIAHLTKVHHCAIDGVSGAEILTTLLDLTPEPRKIDPPRRGWRPEPEPTQLEMLARTAWGMLGAPRKVWRLQRQAIRYLPELARSLGFKGFPGQSIIDRVLRRRPTPMMSEAPTTAPRMSFNGRITPHRRFAFGSISLEDVKEIKNKLGVTVNDVVMAICAGALRRYLLQQNELPPEPLVAMVPVSVRSDDDKQALGNQISAMTASLHTHIAEPIERIKRIHESMRIAKEQHQALPATLLQDFAQFAPPAVAARAARVIARATVANWVDPPFNVVISNVPGPQFPLYGVGAKVVGNYPVSAINDGVALNMTVMSYNGNIDFGLLSCRELMPDIWDLMDFIYESLAELKEAAKAI
jgi:WS/DGAT/MGAT family acyltransferase